MDAEEQKIWASMTIPQKSAFWNMGNKRASECWGCVARTVCPSRLNCWDKRNAATN